VVPRLSTLDAWDRLAGAGPLNRFTLIERGANGELPLPFEDPRTFIAVCRYDISNGPVRVRADFSSDGLVVMSFHDRHGATFYGLTDRGGLRGRLDALIVAWCDELIFNDLDRVLAYRNMAGDSRQRQVGALLSHTCSAPSERSSSTCSGRRTMFTSGTPSFRQMRFSIWPRFEAAAVCTSAR
jgi:hypothetical protein